MRKKEYIWFNDGRESKRTADPEGRVPLNKKLPNGGEIKYTYHERTGRMSGEYYYKSDVIHRDGDRPAWTEWDFDGNKTEEVYKIQGKFHRVGDNRPRLYTTK